MHRTHLNSDEDIFQLCARKAITTLGVQMCGSIRVPSNWPLSSHIYIYIYICIWEVEEVQRGTPYKIYEHQMKS